MRHAFHTIYALLRGPRKREINSCLGVLLTSFVQFLDRGFDNYLQHFVMMEVGASRLSLWYFLFANLKFREGLPTSSILLRATF